MSQIREQVKKEDNKVKSQSVHHSQSDSAKGYGGTYGVQKERQDKVCSWYHISLHYPLENSVIHLKFSCCYHNSTVRV